MTKTDELMKAISDCESQITQTNKDIEVMKNALEKQQERRFELLKESGNDAISRYKRTHKLKGHTEYKGMARSLS